MAKAKQATRKGPVSKPRVRMASEDREHLIVQGALTFFAKHGFAASTRDLAKHLDITQPLLYRYFPTKEALVQRVYEELVRRWNPEWEEWLADRSMPLTERLKRYLKDYADFVLRSEWVRVFIYAGLSRAGINEKYLARLRERHFVVIAREMRHSYKIPEPRTAAELEDEIELIWAMHASVFYIGVRKWVYESATPRGDDLLRMIDMRVDSFLEGAPKVFRSRRQS